MKRVREDERVPGGRLLWHNLGRAVLVAMRREWEQTRLRIEEQRAFLATQPNLNLRYPTACTQCGFVVFTTPCKGCKQHGIFCQRCAFEGYCPTCVQECEYELPGSNQKCGRSVPHTTHVDRCCAQCDTRLCRTHAEFCAACGAAVCRRLADADPCYSEHEIECEERKARETE